MRIHFNWSCIDGLKDWFIEPEPSVKKSITTPNPRIKSTTLPLKRVLPRGKESKGQRNTISLLKKIELQKKRRAHR